MKTTLNLLGLFAGLSLGTTPIPAQSTSAPPLPATTFEYSLSGGLTGRAGAKIGDTRVGNVSTDHWRLDAVCKFPFRDIGGAEVGVALQRVEIDTSGPGVPLPDTLQALALHLGGTWQLNMQWALMGHIRPGTYSDAEADGSDAFSAPAAIFARWSTSREVTWFFGASIDPKSDYSVLPVGGVRWQVSPEWLVSVAFPRSEIACSFSPSTTCFAAAGFDSGSYAIDDPAIVAPAGRSLRDTQLDFRTVRATLGVKQSFRAGWEARIEGGVTFARRFDYFNRDFVVKPRDAGYGALTLSGAF